MPTPGSSRGEGGERGRQVDEMGGAEGLRTAIALTKASGWGMIGGFRGYPRSLTGGRSSTLWGGSVCASSTYISPTSAVRGSGDPRRLPRCSALLIIAGRPSRTTACWIKEAPGRPQGRRSIGLRGTGQAGWRQGQLGGQATRLPQTVGQYLAARIMQGTQEEVSDRGGRSSSREGERGSGGRGVPPEPVRGDGEGKYCRQGRLDRVGSQKSPGPLI